MSKKLINSTESCVDESLEGLVAVYPFLTLLEGGHRVIVRTDINNIRNNKVTLLSGGGSGHEPAHAGYVGCGMLSAAVAGSVFASPPPEAILAGLRAISSTKGTLIIIKNYTGDRLNFGIAAERAKSEGMDVRMVIVNEDTALPKNNKTAGRRGLCGTILVHKIAGAMAERGDSLDDIMITAQTVIDNIGTMSVSLSPCTVPGHKPSFQLEDNEIELGLGIHGEAGIERTKLMTANEVVAKLLDHLTSNDPQYQYFTAGPGSDVGLIVNNLGGTSNLELSLVAGVAIKYLTNKLQYNVSRVYMGSLMTSLEMAGVSLTLLKMTQRLKECLDYPTSAPGWPNVSCTSSGGDRIKTTPISISVPKELPSVDGQVTNEPQTSHGQKLKACIEAICSTLLLAEEELNQLDRGSGDGDCGSTLKSGAEAILQVINTIQWDKASTALLNISDIIERHMGGTSGALYTLLLTSGAKVVGEGNDPVKWVESLNEGIKSIKHYGGADTGDRTMLDALVPAATALQKMTNDTPINTLKEAVQAAKEGAISTQSMTARAGRASYVRTSQLTDPDPGARAVYIWFNAILNTLLK